jgi:DNA primase
MDRLEFPEAVEALASRFGVTIPRRAFRGAREDRREKLLEAVSAAHRFYTAELAKPGNKAAAYLEERDVSRDLSKRLGLGYAPDAWEALSRALLPAFSESLLVEAGLLQPRQEGRSGAYDRFRDRLLFVVRDERGRPVGFGGRVLSSGGDGPKYLNSPETPIFQKKRLLYGLSEARDAIRKRDRAVLVEGYFDHLALVAAGIEETAASMGTALTPEQAGRLKRLCPTVVVCYDGDSAGRAATRGALAHLLAQGLSVRVVRLPPGLDPHDVLRQEGEKRLAARVDEAPDYLTWLLEDANPLEQGIDSAQKSARIAGIVELIGAIPDAILRHEECRRVARHSGVPLDLLWERIRPPARTAPIRPPAGTPEALPVLSDGGIPQPERALLSLLVRADELIPLILEALNDDWVTHGTVRRVVEASRRVVSSSGTIDFPSLIAQLREDSDIQLLARAAAEEGPEPSRRRMDQVLHVLEETYWKRRGQALQEDIQRAEAERRPREEIERLSREKQEIGRRIQELKPSRKGKALVD